MKRSTFAGITILEPDESLSTNGASFTGKDREVIDHLLELGAVTHRHDAHAPLANPTVAPSATALNTGGTFPGGRSFYVGYTRLDDDGGETVLSDVTVISTAEPVVAPSDGPDAAIDYTAGSLRADTYYYALTFTDGAGGETTVGPATAVERAPGYASGRVLFTGLATLVSDADAAGWRLYRATGGGQLDFLASGAGDTFTDDGTVACDCNVRPPTRNRTAGSNRLQITVPDVGAASGFSLYLSETGDFITPALVDSYPAASAGSTITLNGLTLQAGAPPDVSTAKPGASKIDPDTELLDWHWKRPVLNAGDLPAGEAGDVRLVTSEGRFYFLAEEGSGWGEVEVIVGGSGGSGGGGDGGSLDAVLIPGEASVLDPHALAFVGSGGVDLALVASGASAVLTITAASGGTGGGSLSSVSESGGATVDDPEAIVFIAGDDVNVDVSASGASAMVYLNGIVGPPGADGEQGPPGIPGSGNMRVFEGEEHSGDFAAPDGVAFIAGDNVIVAVDGGTGGIPHITISATGGGGGAGGSATASGGQPGGLSEWEPLTLNSGWSELDAALYGSAVVAKDLETGLVYVRAALSRAAGADEIISTLPSGASGNGTFVPDVTHAFVNDQGVGVQVNTDGSIVATDIDDAVNRVLLTMLTYKGAAVPGAGGRGDTVKATLTGTGGPGTISLTAVTDPWALAAAGGVTIKEAGRYTLRALGTSSTSPATLAIARNGTPAISQPQSADTFFNVSIEVDLVGGDAITVTGTGASFTGVTLLVTKVEGTQGAPGGGGAAGANGAPGAPGEDGTPREVQDGNTPMADRNALSFTGTGVDVTDDPGNDRIVVTIGAGSGGTEGGLVWGGDWDPGLEFASGHLVNASGVLWAAYDPEIGVAPSSGNAADPGVFRGSAAVAMPADGEWSDVLSMDDAPVSTPLMYSAAVGCYVWFFDVVASGNVSIELGPFSGPSVDMVAKLFKEPNTATGSYISLSDDAFGSWPTWASYPVSPGRYYVLLGPYDNVDTEPGVNFQYKMTALTATIADPPEEGRWWLVDANEGGGAGTPGPQGEPGEPGEDGADGAPGAAGDDGLPREVQDEGTPLTIRDAINFVGAGVTLTDDPGNDRINVTIPGASGGGGGLAGRDEVVLTTASLASGATETGTVELGASFRLMRVETTRAARVRLYATAAMRGADAARAIGTDPTGNHGLIAEVVTTAGMLDLILSPQVLGSNFESTVTDDIAYHVTNMDTTGTVGVTFTRQPLE